MSTNAIWMEWIEECIKEKHIKYYEYNKFSNIERIGKGAFSKVYRATFIDNGKHVALKSFDLDNTTVKEIVSEVNNWRRRRKNF